MIRVKKSAICRNLHSVAAASEEASTNVHLVSSAIEEILSSLTEGVQQPTKAREITNNAVILATSVLIIPVAGLKYLSWQYLLPQRSIR